MFQSNFLFCSGTEDVSSTPTGGWPLGTSPFDKLADFDEKGHPFVVESIPGSFVESLFSVTASLLPQGRGPQNLKNSGWRYLCQSHKTTGMTMQEMQTMFNVMSDFLL